MTRSSRGHLFPYGTCGNGACGAHSTCMVWCMQQSFVRLAPSSNSRAGCEEEKKQWRQTLSSLSALTSEGIGATTCCGIGSLLLTRSTGRASKRKQPCGWGARVAGMLSSAKNPDGKSETLALVGRPARGSIAVVWGKKPTGDRIRGDLVSGYVAVWRVRGHEMGPVGVCVGTSGVIAVIFVYSLLARDLDMCIDHGDVSGVRSGR